MKNESLKYNFLMSLIRMVSGLLLPIIIMPYINRIFNPELIGKIEYVNAIIGYFTMFTMLGIPVYGVRLISEYREFKEKMGKIILECTIILLITTIVGYIGYIYLIYYNSSIKLERETFCILGLNILFTTFGFEWFYQGIENQKYITVRTVAIKIITLFLILIFVKKEEDYRIYLVILVLSSAINNLLNCFQLKKFIKISKETFTKIEPTKHLKAILITFLAGISMVIYTQIDILMIGNRLGMTYVGLYNVALKFLRLLSSIIPLFGAVLLPRLTKMYLEKKYDEYQEYINLSSSVIILYSVLSSLVLYITSSEIIKIFCGNKFIEAESTLKILSIQIIFSGIAYFLGIIYLYSQKKDKIFLYSVIIAAIINYTLNSYLIPLYKQNGAAIATIISEIAVIASIYIIAKKEIRVLKIISLNNSKYFVVAGIVVMIFRVIKVEFENMVINLAIKATLILVFYILGLLILKEDIVSVVLKKLKIISFMEEK